MKYPCGMIRDLLPLYIDEVCNEESRHAVEDHLAECEECTKFYEAMTAEEIPQKGRNCDGEDMKMASSLKNIKKKINRKMARIVLCAVMAVLVCVGGYHLLFNAAIKDVPLESISFSANVYSVEELIENQEWDAEEDDPVIVSADKDDTSATVAVRIPEIGGEMILLTESVKEKYQSISVITVKSDYFLRNVKDDRKEDTIYITAIKTTLLNNKATEFQHNICSLEFGEINRIVFVDGNGVEIVLWSR